MKIVFDLITYPLSLFDDALYDWIAMAIVGEIAFGVAWYVVGQLELRGELGSIAHWTIRLFVFAFVWAVMDVVIWAVKFTISYWIYILSIAGLVIFLIILICYARNHPNSILNKIII